jgi:pyruvate dehydrogenase E2 component (dihydrolipoamide acetyltransferase)
VPAVRELAKRLGVDLAAVRGSGPGGRVMRRDVEEAARAAAAPKPAPVAAAPPAVAEAPMREAGAQQEPLRVRSEESPRYGAADPADWQRVPLRGVRRAIAKHMSEARKRAAHFTYVDEVDLTRLLAERDRAARTGRVPKLSPLVFIARAVVRTLPQHPQLNASLDDERGELVLKGKVHLGIAAATEEGLVVPVVHDAASFSTLGLAAEIERLAEAGRAGRLTPAELRGGTFTITSLGKLGGLVSTPIVNWPEVAILGVNAVRRLPRYVEDALLPREVMNLSISVDHRVADGDHAARFVADVKALLEQADFSDVFGEPDGAERSGR